jgi:polyisoprenoid-binding protein YceI
MRSLLFAFLLVCFSPFAKQLSPDANTASLKFHGEHAGRAFSGIFEKWSAKLVLPPSVTPSVTATFSLASAKTGNAMYDETLVESDWFDIDNTPTASFESIEVTAIENGYSVNGNLSLRDVTKPVRFTLTNSNDGLAADFTINRLDYGIGVESDPDAEWVSKEIRLELFIPSE